jgi:uncharacterized membrane protein YkgB
MSTFVYILGFIIFCVGTAMVANTLKFPLGPLGTLLVIGGVLICLFLPRKIEKWRDAKEIKKFCRR